MNKLSFREYLLEATGEMTFSWGRMNPPTIGHEKLLDAVKSNASGKYVVYLSQSQDKKKNPLAYTDKVKFARKMFPRHARNIALDNSVRTVFDLLTQFYDDGYTKIKMVVGSDRVNQFEALLNQYNGVEGRHGFYNFESISVVSAGERDPDADGAEGMSASKMRAAATNNDFTEFSKGLPSKYKDGQSLFNAVRKGMGLKESQRQHIQLPTVSEEREAFINGELYQEGDWVRIKISENYGRITRLGSNYIMVQVNEDEKPKRMWLDSVENINLDEDTMSDIKAWFSRHKDKKKYEFAVRLFLDMRKKNPGQANRMLQKVAQMTALDVRIIDKVMRDMVRDGKLPDHLLNYRSLQKPVREDKEAKKRNPKYHSGLGKSTKDKRQAQFNKQAKMDDDDPRAYKPAPGDASAKTKPSKHTKKFAQMFGEENLGEDTKKALQKKADKTGIPYGILKQVFDRGVAAWRTGHRPGTTPTQWGLARVNSFATKGKGTWGKADKDLAAKVRG